MVKKLIKINSDGYILFGEEKIVKSDHVNTDTINYVENMLPTDEYGNQLAFYKPKWNGSEWIEGESEEEKLERESTLLLESIYPTPAQIEDAKLEIKSIQILTELEVIS